MRRVIWLQTATVFWLGGGNISQLLNVQGLTMLGRQKYIQQNYLVPEPGAFEFEVAIAKLKIYKSPGIDQMPAELINLLATDFFFKF